MVGRLKKKVNRKRPSKVLTMAIIFISLAVVITAYTVTATALGEKAVEGFRLMFGANAGRLTRRRTKNR